MLCLAFQPVFHCCLTTICCGGVCYYKEIFFLRRRFGNYIFIFFLDQVDCLGVEGVLQRGNLVYCASTRYSCNF